MTAVVAPPSAKQLFEDLIGLNQSRDLGSAVDVLPYIEKQVKEGNVNVVNMRLQMQITAKLSSTLKIAIMTPAICVLALEGENPFKDVVRLLELGANPNLRPERTAVVMESVDFQMFGGEPPAPAQIQRLWTALMVACGHKCPRTVKALLSAKAEVDTKSEQGYTALHISSSELMPAWS